MKHILASCLFSVAVVVGIPAQATHVVPTGGDIGLVVAAASPGDIVLVEPGTYAPFSAEIGVTIRATQQPVVVAGVVSLSAPAGQSMHLVGVHVEGFALASGRVSMDHCSIDSTTEAAIRAIGASLHLQSCEFRRTQAFAYGFPLLWAHSSDVTCVDCEFADGDGPFVPVFPETLGAIRLQSSRLHASGISVRGANETLPGTSPGLHGNGLVADAGSAAWISDSSFAVGSNACILAPATAAVVLRFHRCSFQGQCEPIPQNELLLGVERPSPLVAGETFELRYHTDPVGVRRRVRECGAGDRRLGAVARAAVVAR